MSTTSKCAHPACHCVPAPEKKHCSDACADAKNATKTTCQCVHPAVSYTHLDVYKRQIHTPCLLNYRSKSPVRNTERMSLSSRKATPRMQCSSSRAAK